MICLDSSIVIDFLNGRKEAVSLIEKNRDRVAITEITTLEIFFGIYVKKNPSGKEENEALNFFSSLDILPMKKSSGRLAGKILADLSKRGIILEQNDALIASIMLKNGCNTIITKNRKHFSKIKDIKVISY